MARTEDSVYRGLLMKRCEDLGAEVVFNEDTTITIQKFYTIGLTYRPGVVPESVVAELEQIAGELGADLLVMPQPDFAAFEKLKQEQQKEAEAWLRSGGMALR